MPPTASAFLRTSKWYVLTIAALFIVSRMIYYWLGVRFDTGPLGSWWVIDPVLLRDAPWQSLLYLRAQLPGFNFYVAVIMHLFPRHSASAFHATYLVLGLMLGISLFLLLDRLHVSRPLSLLITVLCVVSPATVLYENWLSYEYPLAVLFCTSALFLHRYATSQHQTDGLAFFTSLASIGLFRVIYHLIWFGLIVAVIIYALPRCRRRTALCAAAPTALLLITYLKSLVLFGLFVPGSDTYGAVNFAFLTSLQLPRDVLASMVARKEISPILLHGFRFEDEELVDVVPLPPKTGIRILDQRLKSTDGIIRINMDSLWMAAIGEQLRRDGLAILRSHPAAILKQIRRNTINYFLPSDIGWPFGSPSEHSNQLILLPLLKFEWVMSGKHPKHNYAIVSYVVGLCVLWFGFRRSVRWLKRLIRRPNGNARELTIAFAFGNIAYLSAVVILYDFTDQNRILFEVFPLFTVLLGTLLALEWRRRAARCFIPTALDIGNNGRMVAERGNRSNHMAWGTESSSAKQIHK